MSAQGGGGWPPALAQLHEACRLAQRCCRSLRRWSPRATLRSGRDSTWAWAGLLLRCFDVEVPAFFHHHHELLLPALMEAVAGSDPVCLRGMAADHEAGRRKVLEAWEVVRAGLEGLASGGSGTLKATDVEAFTGPYGALLAHAQEELLPMADRLLSQEQLRALDSALGETRSP